MAKRATKAKTPEAAKRAARTVTLGSGASEPTEEPQRQGPRYQRLELEKIRIDGGTQIRVALDKDTVNEYALKMAEGVEFPAIDVFFDGSAYWLGDGFHRYFGQRKASDITPQTLASTFSGKAPSIMCDIRTGTQRDAQLHAIRSNHTHGKPRTNIDKRRAVEVMLQDSEWSGWADTVIAKEAGVSHTMVGNIRRELATVAGCEQPETTIGADGKARKRPKASDRSKKPQEANGSTKRPDAVDRPAPDAADRADAAEAETDPHAWRESVGLPPIPEEFRQATTPAMGHARRALAELDQILLDDPLRWAALQLVQDWIKDQV